MDRMKVFEWVENHFQHVPMWLIEEHRGFEDGELWWGNVDEMVPMWGTAFLFDDNNMMVDFMTDMEESVNGMGFSILYDARYNDRPIALGIDGAGYDFYDAHWNKLYEAFYDWMGKRY